MNAARSSSPKARSSSLTVCFFFFNDTATTEIYTLSLHDALPISYSFIVPDAEHDAHDCPGGGSNCDIGTRVAAADTWLSNNVPQLLANPQFQQSGILVITTDESRNDITNGGGRVATILVGTKVKAGYVGTVSYD